MARETARRFFPGSLRPQPKLSIIRDACDPDLLCPTDCEAPLGEFFKGVEESKKEKELRSKMEKFKGMLP